MKITNSEHVNIDGRTGTGKTFLARQYLAGFESVFVLDTKGMFAWPEIPGTIWSEHYLVDGNKELEIVNSVNDLANAQTAKVIYRPNYDELNFDYYDEFFKFCYFRGNTTVLVDEAFSICPTPYKIPEFYRAILTRGRELKVSCWSLTQRPSGIPQIILSEATHYFVFDLNLQTDRDKMAVITGCEELREKPGFIMLDGQKIPCFWYFNANHETAHKRYLQIERR